MRLPTIYPAVWGTFLGSNHLGWKRLSRCGRFICNRAALSSWGVLYACPRSFCKRTYSLLHILANLCFLFLQRPYASQFELREFPSLYACCVFFQGIHGEFVFLANSSSIFPGIIVTPFVRHIIMPVYFMLYISFINTTPYIYIHNTYVRRERRVQAQCLKVLTFGCY